ncbi:MAG TPA: YraN family protein [Candidatus Limnocylindria bacterium]|nr:YraN family protein [Candidatus Limnocylindria bacterium]
MGIAKTRGEAGETLAAAYLTLAGQAVRARNHRVGGVEVDLLADDAGTTVLVEVKLRGRSDYGGAALAVDRRKRERLLRAARALLQSGSARVRIDVVTVELSLDGATIRHYRNAVTE